MLVIPNECLTGVDVDETLVNMVNPYKEENGTPVGESNGVLLLNYDLSVEDPYGILGTIFLKRNNPNINMVKRGHARGYEYFIWSRAGVKWAELIARELDMEMYFEFCMSKPAAYVDDLPCEQWMGERSWLPAHTTGWQQE